MDPTYTCQSENDQMGGEKNDDSMIIIRLSNLLQQIQTLYIFD
jgi:hypothetical protein